MVIPAVLLPPSSRPRAPARLCCSCGAPVDSRRRYCGSCARRRTHQARRLREIRPYVCRVAQVLTRLDHVLRSADALTRPIHYRLLHLETDCAMLIDRWMVAHLAAHVEKGNHATE